MGLKVQSTAYCFPESCSFQFSVAQVLAGLRTKCINNVIFPTLIGPVLLALTITLMWTVSMHNGPQLHHVPCFSIDVKIECKYRIASLILKRLINL